ncbi:copper resistance protein CopC [Microbacterium sp. ZW T5_45]|uniref:copper resistance CopC family protein n=1 Tax=Microbacterium sp. ZW T5_45 TaxID=3378080 RepID=UPI003851B939
MSPVRRFAVGLAVAAVAILATAAPASAHDSLISSTPEADQRLESAPETIQLVFSGELLVLGDTGDLGDTGEGASAEGTVVLIVDEAGHDWAGDAEVRGNTVTIGVEPGMPDAGYQVRWQVVSEDGHPIAGTVPFTIGDAEPYTASAQPTHTATDAPASGPDQTTENSETDGALRALLVGGAGAAVAVIALVLFRILRRPRTAPAEPAQGDDADEL